ncbi:hypothetical protein KUCAC02_030026, partial [Chaenocephalus aceratus]
HHRPGHEAVEKETLRSPQYLRPYRPSQTASSPSPPQDHHPCCEETQQLSLDLPLPTPPNTTQRRLLSPSSTHLHNISSRDMKQQLLLVSLPAYSSGAML